MLSIEYDYAICGIKKMIESAKDRVTKRELNMAVDALEKQIPVKPIRVSNDRTDGCPICKTEFYEKFNFCPTCGKAMDWSS